ncbi:Soluble epoxide hydrolase [Alienimonas californiensis]|uniref:Soluble epoxide hydrolase n=2 Tax=Alienimonas californiensis TaxID=2527989 RepID=A0A517P9Q7_9PLAN|nr:Soluble epoxide hydrolase [Alienimonas californiensis]
MLCVVVRCVCTAGCLLAAGTAVGAPPAAPMPVFDRASGSPPSVSVAPADSHGAGDGRVSTASCESGCDTARGGACGNGRSGGCLPPKAAAWLAGGQFFNDRGRPIFFRREGRGPTLLVIHGFPTSSYDYAEMWPALTARFDVIAVDLLGSGFSDKPFPYDYSVLEQANILERFTTALGVDRAHVLAHDYGGTVTQELLARQNEGRSSLCLESVTFLNGGLFIQAQCLTPIHYLFDSPLGVPVGALTCEPAFKCITKSFMGQAAKAGAVDLDGMWAILNYNRGQRVLHGIIQYLDERKQFERRWTAALAHARCPLAYVYGAEDKVSGDTIARRFSEVVPHAPVVRMCGVEHYPHTEAPARTAAIFHALHDGWGAPPAGAPAADRSDVPPPAPAPR